MNADEIIANIEALRLLRREQIEDERLLAQVKRIYIENQSPRG